MVIKPTATGKQHLFQAEVDELNCPHEPLVHRAGWHNGDGTGAVTSFRDSQIGQIEGLGVMYEDLRRDNILRQSQM